MFWGTRQQGRNKLDIDMAIRLPTDRVQESIALGANWVGSRPSFHARSYAREILRYSVTLVMLVRAATVQNRPDLCSCRGENRSHADPTSPLAGPSRRSRIVEWSKAAPRTGRWSERACACGAVGQGRAHEWRTGARSVNFPIIGSGPNRRIGHARRCYWVAANTGPSTLIHRRLSYYQRNKPSM